MNRAVLFDLDRTLLDRETSFLNFVKSQYERFFSQLSHIPKDSYIHRVVTLDNQGLLWKDEVYKRIVQEFDLQSPDWEQLFSDFDARIADYYVPFPHMREMLEALKRQGYRLALVTNGKGYFQRRTIQALKIEQDFDALLISEEEGLRKPHPAIFLRALARVDCQPHEAVFVGDSLDADIRGAKRASLLTVWKTDGTVTENAEAAIEADAVVEDLQDLPAIIGKLETRSKLL